MNGVRARRTARKYVFIYAMLSIAIANFLIFYVYVNFRSFLMPFQNADGMWTLENMRNVWGQITSGSSGLMIPLRNTLTYYVTGIASQFIISLFFGYCLYRKILGFRFFNIIFLIPMIVSSVVLVSVFKSLLATGGAVSVVWEFFSGKTAPAFMFDERYATASIVAYVLFTGLGLNMIIFSGAMSRIPPDIWEQSKLDGLGFIRGMFSIALPLIWPTYSILLLLGTVGILGADAPILLFSGGMYETSTLGYWMYQNVVLYELYNYASALGLFMTIVSLPVFFIVIYIRKKLPDDIQY